ncbi:hypothetical protein NH340_JMT05983 [Sarcoptes scabiei]|nr:hypothetical protein NH340_JMT05983 [Sarcoptes scabiei]
MISSKSEIRIGIHIIKMLIKIKNDFRAPKRYIKTKIKAFSIILIIFSLPSFNLAEKSLANYQHPPHHHHEHQLLREQLNHLPSSPQALLTATTTKTSSATIADSASSTKNQRTP